MLLCLPTIQQLLCPLVATSIAAFGMTTTVWFDWVEQVDISICEAYTCICMVPFFSASEKCGIVGGGSGGGGGGLGGGGLTQNKQGCSGL